MIKTTAGWIGLGLVLAIVLELLEAPPAARLGVAAVYLIVSFPVIYLRWMATSGRAGRVRR